MRAVVGHALDGRLRAHDPVQRLRQLLPRGVEQRDVVEAGVAPGGAGARLLVQHQHVLRAGAEGRHPVIVPVDPEPDRVLVERDRAVEVGDREVGGAQSHLRRLLDGAHVERELDLVGHQHVAGARAPG